MKVYFYCFLPLTFGQYLETWSVYVPIIFPFYYLCLELVWKDRNLNLLVIIKDLTSFSRVIISNSFIIVLTKGEGFQDPKNLFRLT